MKEDSSASDLREAIARWQQKHGIGDDDPAFAWLELFDLYVETLRARTPDSPPLRFEEFRSTLELLDVRSKTFVKHSAELIQELRGVAQTQRQLRDVSMTAVLIAACSSFIVGALMRHFLW